MRLTDDYIIISDQKNVVKNMVKSLFECASENNFEFNYDKLRANFKMDKFQMESNETQFKWIGKIFNLKTMELFHT